MASAAYPSALDAILTAGVNLSTADIRCTLIDSADYTYSAAHDFYDDVPSAARVAEFTLTGKTVSGGVFDAADGTFTSVTGDPSEALILRVYNATETASRLLFYIDGISVTPNGGNINVAWDNGTNKIVKFG
jgi:hypothetical protein